MTIKLLFTQNWTRKNNCKNYKQLKIRGIFFIILTTNNNNAKRLKTLRINELVVGFLYLIRKLQNKIHFKFVL